MKSKAENKVVLSVGKKGKGKTTFIKMLSFLTLKPAIIIDNLNQFEGQGFKPDECLNYLKDNVKNFYTYKEQLIVRSDDEAIVEEFLRVVYNSLSNILLVIDEIDLFTNPHKSQQSILRKLFRYARNKEISIYCTAKRLSNLDKDLTSSIDLLALFQITELRDLEILEKYIKKGISEQVKHLKTFEYLLYDLNKDEIQKKKIPNGVFKYV